MKTEYFRTIKSIDHSQSDYILLMKLINDEDAIDPYLVYVNFSGHKYKQRFNSLTKAENLYNIMSNLYYFTIEETFENNHGFHPSYGGVTPF